MQAGILHKAAARDALISAAHPNLKGKDQLCSWGTATVETLLKDMGMQTMVWLHIKLQPTLRSSTRSRFRIMEYVSRNWLSSLVALPVIIFLISLSSGICSNVL